MRQGGCGAVNAEAVFTAWRRRPRHGIEGSLSLRTLLDAVRVDDRHARGGLGEKPSRRVAIAVDLRRPHPMETTRTASSDSGAHVPPALHDRMTKPLIILYVRENCEHCEEALALLSRLNLSPRVIDVTDDETISQRYGTCVPVVLIDGRVRFRGKVSEVLLRRILRKHLS
jgi:glutaredoxin